MNDDIECMLRKVGIQNPQVLVLHAAEHGLVKFPVPIHEQPSQENIHRHFSSPKERWDFYNQRAKERRALGHVISL